MKFKLSIYQFWDFMVSCLFDYTNKAQLLTKKMTESYWNWWFWPLFYNNNWNLAYTVIRWFLRFCSSSSFSLFPTESKQMKDRMCSIITTRNPQTMMILLVVTREARGSSGWQPIIGMATLCQVYPALSKSNGSWWPSDAMRRNNIIIDLFIPECSNFSIRKVNILINWPLGGLNESLDL